MGVINPNSSTSIQTQQTAAIEAQYELSPGDQFPSESAPTAPAGSSPSSSPSPSSSAGSSNGSKKSGGGGLSGGAIAGIVVGCVAAVALVGALIFYYAKSRAYSHIFSASQKGNGSSAPGGSSDAGGNVGAWVASQQQQHPEKLGMDAEAQAQRGSYQTPSGSPRPTAPGSPTPEQGAQFVGYNRQSGGAEYAFEAPGIDHQINELPRDRKANPPSNTAGRVELP